MSTMSAADAAALFTNLRGAEVRCWVIGGWGVDALLTRTTRAHHDLDLLVHVADLPALDAWLSASGFKWLYDWDETRPIHLDGQSWSSAFVAGHPDGRELDIHAIDVLPDGSCSLATDDPWHLPDDTITGTGSIDGVSVTCVSSQAQLAMHTGYELPAHHLEDLDALRRDPGAGSNLESSHTASSSAPFETCVVFMLGYPGMGNGRSEAIWRLCSTVCWSTTN